MFSAKEIFDIAIQLEKNGESVYRKAMERITDTDLKILLAWISDEEIKHADWFSELKQSVESGSENPVADEMGRMLLNEMVGNQSFSLKEVDFDSLDQLNDLISVFVEFEKDTILFYEMLQPFVQDAKTLDHLKKIIDEENHHIKLLEAFAESGLAETACGDSDSF